MEKVDMNLVTQLEEKAAHIRKMVVKYCHNVGVAHIGGCLSSTDIITALYYHYLDFDPKDYQNPKRDRFILSKGHSANLLYNVFCDMGIFTEEEIFNEYNKPEGRFGQHPNRFYLPMFDASTGSLGHGLSIAVGYALGARASKENYRVFCEVGDGELDEGSNWEAIMLGAHQQLQNLILIVDRNGIQGSRKTETTVALDSLEDKLKAFHWNVIGLEDGNDMEQVVGALESLPERNYAGKAQPTAIIAHTIKGKGVRFMENNPAWHLGSVDDQMMKEAFDSIDAERTVRG